MPAAQVDLGHQHRHVRAVYSVDGHNGMPLAPPQGQRASSPQGSRVKVRPWGARDGDGDEGKGEESDAGAGAATTGPEPGDDGHGTGRQV